MLDATTLPPGDPLATPPHPASSPSMDVRAKPYLGMIHKYASQHKINPAILKGLLDAESSFDPKAKSPVGAEGLGQFMPGTAAGEGVTDPFNAEQSIAGAARYFAELKKRFGGDDRLALAAYNAGPNAVEQYGGIPPYKETQDYVNKILPEPSAFAPGQPEFDRHLPPDDPLAPSAPAAQEPWIAKLLGAAPAAGAETLPPGDPLATSTLPPGDPLAQPTSAPVPKPAVPVKPTAAAKPVPASMGWGEATPLDPKLHPPAAVTPNPAAPKLPLPVGYDASGAALPALDDADVQAIVARHPGQAPTAAEIMTARKAKQMNVNAQSELATSNAATLMTRAGELGDAGTYSLADAIQRDPKAYFKGQSKYTAIWDTPMLTFSQKLDAIYSDYGFNAPGAIAYWAKQPGFKGDIARWKADHQGTLGGALATGAETFGAELVNPSYLATGEVAGMAGRGLGATARAARESNFGEAAAAAREARTANAPPKPPPSEPPPEGAPKPPPGPVTPPADAPRPPGLTDDEWAIVKHRRKSIEAAAKRAATAGKPAPEPEPFKPPEAPKAAAERDLPPTTDLPPGDPLASPAAKKVVPPPPKVEAAPPRTAEPAAAPAAEAGPKPPETPVVEPEVEPKAAEPTQAEPPIEAAPKTEAPPESDASQRGAARIPPVTKEDLVRTSRDVARGIGNMLDANEQMQRALGTNLGFDKYGKVFAAAGNEGERVMRWLQTATGKAEHQVISEQAVPAFASGKDAPHGLTQAQKIEVVRRIEGLEPREMQDGVDYDTRAALKDHIAERDARMKEVDPELHQVESVGYFPRSGMFPLPENVVQDLAMRRARNRGGVMGGKGVQAQRVHVSMDDALATMEENGIKPNPNWDPAQSYIADSLRKEMFINAQDLGEQLSNMPTRAGTHAMEPVEFYYRNKPENPLAPPDVVFKDKAQRNKFVKERAQIRSMMKAADDISKEVSAVTGKDVKIPFTLKRRPTSYLRGQMREQGKEGPALYRVGNTAYKANEPKAYGAVKVEAKRFEARVKRATDDLNKATLTRQYADAIRKRAESYRPQLEAELKEATAHVPAGVRLPRSGAPEAAQDFTHITSADLASRMGEPLPPSFEDKVVHRDFADMLVQAGARRQEAADWTGMFEAANSIFRILKIANPIRHRWLNLPWNSMLRGLSIGDTRAALTDAGLRSLEKDYGDRFDSAGGGAYQTPRILGVKPENQLKVRFAHDSELKGPAKVARKIAGLTDKNTEFVFNSGERGLSLGLFKKFAEHDHMTDFEAAREVRRTFGDPGNLDTRPIGGFGISEQQLAKMFLFYPWTKANIPLWIKYGWLNPKVVLAAEQATRSFNENQGTYDPTADENTLQIPLPNGGTFDIKLPLPQASVLNRAEKFAAGDPSQALMLGMEHVNPILSPLAAGAATIMEDPQTPVSQGGSNPMIWADKSNPDFWPTESSTGFRPGQVGQFLGSTVGEDVPQINQAERSMLDPKNLIGLLTTAFTYDKSPSAISHMEYIIRNGGYVHGAKGKVGGYEALIARAKKAGDMDTARALYDAEQAALQSLSSLGGQ
jgi:hypothetical protein